MYVVFIGVTTRMNTTNTMCSQADCAFKSFYTIDGKQYCKFHNPIELGTCGALKRNGDVCGCRARRSYNGVHTCLVHIPKSSEPVCCSICLEDCQIGTKPTKCGHVFHRSCMDKWRERSNGHSCPMCRTELSKPIKFIPSGDLMARLTEIARESADADAFIENVIRTVNRDEFEFVRELIRTY
jgi:hypothetical protein